MKGAAKGRTVDERAEHHPRQRLLGSSRNAQVRREAQARDGGNEDKAQRRLTRLAQFWRR